MSRRLLYAGSGALALLFAAGAAWAKPEFREGFESGGLGTLTGGTNNGGGRVKIEMHDGAAPKALGKYYVSGTMMGDEAFGSTQRRMYLGTIRTSVQEGQDSFMSMYVLAKQPPKARDNFFYYESSGNKNVLTWWVMPKGDGGTIMSLGTGNLGSRGTVWTGDFAIGQWHQVATHIHWGKTDATGSLTLWLDGVKVLDDHEVQTMEDASTHFSHPGIHRDSGKSPEYFKGVDTLSFDNVITGRSLEDIELMAPGDAPLDGGVGDSGAANPGSPDASARDARGTAEGARMQAAKGGTPDASPRGGRNLPPAAGGTIGRLNDERGGGCTMATRGRVSSAALWLLFALALGRRRRRRG